jgi:septum formation protein
MSSKDSGAQGPTSQPLFVLASASPRRRELLEACGLCFEILPTEIDESPEPGETPENLVLRLATLKARSVAVIRPSLPILSADTVVVLNGDIFGKPENQAQARAMLERLSGKEHRVMTGYCVTGGPSGREKAGLVVSEIVFRNLTKAEIDRYLALDQSLDKAGAYAIQMGGGFMTDRLKGSYTNIVGLPLKEVLEALSEVLGEEIFEK